MQNRPLITYLVSPGSGAKEIVVGVPRLRGWGDGDLVSHGLQVAKQPLLACFGIVVPGEVVRAEVAVLGVVVQDMPDDHDEGVGDGDGGLPAAGLTEPAVHATEAGAT